MKLTKGHRNLLGETHRMCFERRLFEGKAIAIMAFCVGFMAGMLFLAAVK